MSDHIDASWDKVPGAIALPSFYEAPILSGTPVPEFPPCDYVFCVLAPALGVPEDVRRIGVSLSADSRMFARMLAKIGLGIAVAHLGTEGYEPLVRNLILKGADQLGLVGGNAGKTRADLPTKDFHTVSLTTNGGLRGRFIVAGIRLYAEFNGPTNYVVVGRWQ